jgi:hypothetical protein
MSPRKVILLFLVLEISIALIAVLSHGYSLTALQTAARFSGSISLFLFSAIFLLHDKPETINTWLSNRFYLLFALVHGIHSIELALYLLKSGTELIPYRVAGGILAIVYILLMPLFKLNTALGRMSTKSFYAVEKVFIYYIWTIFFFTYLPRVQGTLPTIGGSFAEHVVLLGWVSTLVGMKLAGLIQFQKRKSK